MDSSVTFDTDANLSGVQTDKQLPALALLSAYLKDRHEVYGRWEDARGQCCLVGLRGSEMLFRVEVDES